MSICLFGRPGLGLLGFVWGFFVAKRVGHVNQLINNEEIANHSVSSKSSDSMVIGLIDS